MEFTYPGGMRGLGVLEEALVEKRKMKKRGRRRLSILCERESFRSRDARVT